METAFYLHNPLLFRETREYVAHIVMYEEQPKVYEALFRFKAEDLRRVYTALQISQYVTLQNRCLMRGEEIFLMSLPIN